MTFKLAGRPALTLVFSLYFLATSAVLADFGDFGVRSVSLNGQGNDIQVEPGENVTLNIDYFVSNPTACPGCIDQLVVGVEDRTLDCIYSNIPPVSPAAEGSKTVSFDAPVELGVYRLFMVREQQFTCQDALNLYSPERVNVYGILIGTVKVGPPLDMEVFLTQPSYTEGADVNGKVVVNAIDPIQGSLDIAVFDEKQPPGEQSVIHRQSIPVTLDNNESGSFPFTIPDVSVAGRLIVFASSDSFQSACSCARSFSAAAFVSAATPPQ